MAHYLNSHHSGGFRYQRAVPHPLRPIIGRKVIVEYIPAMARSKAEELARTYAVRDSATFNRLKGLTEQQRAEAVAMGGLEEIKATIPLLQSSLVSDAELRASAAARDPYLIEKLTNGAWTAERAALVMVRDSKVTEAEAVMAAQLERSQAIVLQAAPITSEESFDGLLALWAKVRQPKMTDEHKRTVRLLVSVLGNMRYQDVTQAHIARFRDANEESGMNRPSQVKHLERAAAMFAAAVSENRIPANPAKGIKVRGKAPIRKSGQDRPFTGKQLKHILDTAKRERFGGERHEAAMWVLRLLAWTGARPSEITQLRKCDVTKDGTHIRAGHEQQSVKNGESVRTIPVHPEVAGFVKYAATSKTDFIFDCFPWNRQKGRRGWLDIHFGPFMRDVCAIDAPGLTLYSMRHRYHDAMRDAAIAEDRQRYLVGHASGDVHGKYGRGAGLRELAKDVARINVMRD